MRCRLCFDTLTEKNACCLACANMEPSKSEGATINHFAPPDMSPSLRERFKALFEDYLEDVKAVQPDMKFAEISVTVRPDQEDFFSVGWLSGVERD